MAGTTNWPFFPCCLTVSIRQKRNRYWRVCPMALQSHARPADRNMTTHCVLSPNDYRRMPWKNGVGHTTANRHPSGGCGSRVVRVAGQRGRSHAGRSLFSVCRRRSHAGPADRRRDEAGGLPRADGVAHAFEPLNFSGDEALNCSLVAGPVRDFNLMVRRGAARRQCRRPPRRRRAHSARGHVRLLRGARSVGMPGCRPSADFARRGPCAAGDAGIGRGRARTQREPARRGIGRAGRRDPAAMNAGPMAHPRIAC